MLQDDNVQAVMSLLFGYVKSPSLRHIRDPHMLHGLARDIVKKLDRGTSIWRKWEGEREPFVKAAANCWIPVEDLRTFLNDLPGPHLTHTDVTEHLRAVYEEQFASYPVEALQAGCLEMYAREKVAGTEMPAIVGALRDHVEREEQRLADERRAAWQRQTELDKAALEQRFLSGADCKWTPLQGSPALFCRMNGRSYRLSPAPDKRWDLHRIGSVEDKGVSLGRYAQRRDVTKALAEIAYRPELTR